MSSFAGSTLYTIGLPLPSPINGIAAYYTGQYQNFKLVATDSYNVVNATGGTFAGLLGYINQPNATPTSFAIGPTALYGANGLDNWSYRGSTIGWFFSLGKPHKFFDTTTVQGSGAVPGISGTVVIYYAFIREDGFIGPALAQTYSGFAGATLFRSSLPGFLSPGGGASYGSFGISAMQVWVQLNDNAPAQQAAAFNLYGITSGVHGLTLTFGFTADFKFTAIQPDDFQGTFYYGLGSTQGSGSTFTGTAPGVIETFANQLFSFVGSRAIFSRPGEFEKADYENFFDVAIEDPSDITNALRFYTQLLIWKFGSTWALSGTGPDTFVLTQVSDIYGCISKTAACVWDQHLWFVDEKGIFEFNGSNVECVSSKVQPYFDLLNVAAADAVKLEHVKDRNEVWCSLPINGSTVANLILVYDYLSNAWTTRTPPPGNLTALSAIASGVSKTVVYYGGSGLLGTFGNSMIGDAGVAATQVIKSRFIEGGMGNNVTKVFRKLWVDAAIPTGMTFPIGVNFYADKSSTPYLSTTMALTGYQDRINLGIPAKSVAVEFIYSGATFLQFNGFTIAYRFQRNT